VPLKWIIKNYLELYKWIPLEDVPLFCQFEYCSFVIYLWQTRLEFSACGIWEWNELLLVLLTFPENTKTFFISFATFIYKGKLTVLDNELVLVGEVDLLVDKLRDSIISIS
jgi:hypothetical protein